MPRLGLGSVDVSSAGGSGQDVVTTIDDFFFESNASGEVNPILTTSRTNLIPHSQDFNSTVGSFSYSKVGSSTVTNNSTTAPDGTNTAALVTKGTNDLVLRANNVVETGKTYTFSCFVKSSGSGVTTVSIDITDDSLTAFTLTNDWQRISVTAQVTRTPQSTFNFVDMAVNGSQNDTFYTWGWQVEENGFISAHIPTSGSTVTVSTTLNDTSEVWDFDGTDIMLEADPEDEGFWEEGSNLVLNHDYAELSSEQVTGFTNGSVYPFDTLTTSGNDITSAIVSSAFAGAVSNSISVASGEVYKVTFDYTKNSGDDLRVAFSSVQTGAGAQISNNELISASGSYTKYFTITSTTTGYLQMGTGNSGHSLNASIENVSVKQVDPNDRWVLDDGWSIEDGKAVCDGSQSSNADLDQSNFISTLKGAQYETTYTISNYSAGTIKIRFSSGNVTTERSSNGTFTEIITAAGNGGFRLRASSTFAGSVDNVTLREYAVQPKDI